MGQPIAIDAFVSSLTGHVGPGRGVFDRGREASALVKCEMAYPYCALAIVSE
jgi:hypothetical protein